jgi:hypothetical protein
MPVTLSGAEFIKAQQCNYADELRSLNGRLPSRLTVTTTALRWVLLAPNNHLEAFFNYTKVFTLVIALCKEI